MPHHIGGVMVSLHTPSVVDLGLEHWLGQTKDYIKFVFEPGDHFTKGRKS